MSDRTDPLSLQLSESELTLLNNALNEILHGPEAIEAWEFQTRTGVEVAEAQALLTRIGKLLETAYAH